jgi:hypothetical protein
MLEGGKKKKSKKSSGKKPASKKSTSKKTNKTNKINKPMDLKDIYNKTAMFNPFELSVIDGNLLQKSTLYQPEYNPFFQTTITSSGMPLFPGLPFESQGYLKNFNDINLGAVAGLDDSYKHLLSKTHAKYEEKEFKPKNPKGDFTFKGGSMKIISSPERVNSEYDRNAFLRSPLAGYDYDFNKKVEVSLGEKEKQYYGKEFGILTDKPDKPDKIGGKRKTTRGKKSTGSRKSKRGKKISGGSYATRKVFM